MPLKPFSAISFFILIALCTGTGTAAPYQSVEELTREARSGNPRAMNELALSYYHGKGVLKDPFKAKCWVMRAREQGERTGDDLALKDAEKNWNRLKLWQYTGECPDVEETPSPSRPSGGDLFVEPVTGMTLVWVPAGCFFKGGPIKRKICPEGFWMGQTEVTQAQWERIIPRNPSRFRGPDLPVEQVTYDQVLEFIQALNRQTRLHFSLPTEDLWEFACTDRGRHGPYPWGREDLRPQTNCAGCDAGRFRGKSAPVGSFPANRLGLFDMGGNVREWCRDTRRGRRDHGHKATDRPVRGGSFVDNAAKTRCSSGDRQLTGIKAYYIGFRVMAEPLD